MGVSTLTPGHTNQSPNCDKEPEPISHRFVEMLFRFHAKQPSEHINGYSENVISDKLPWAAPKLQTSYKRMQLTKKGKGLRNKNRKKIAKKLPSNRRRNKFSIFKQKSTESKLSLYLSGGDLQNYFQKMQFKSLFKSPIM